jgi:hypothetical protein
MKIVKKTKKDKDVILTAIHDNFLCEFSLSNIKNGYENIGTYINDNLDVTPIPRFSLMADYFFDALFEQYKIKEFPDN